MLNVLNIVIGGIIYENYRFIKHFKLVHICILWPKIIDCPLREIGHRTCINLTHILIIKYIFCLNIFYLPYCNLRIDSSLPILISIAI